MKNIYIVVLLSLVVLFNGCKEDFLETTSTQTVDEQAVFNDTQSAMLAVNGLHKLMWTGDLSSSAFYGGYDMLMIWYEVMGDDFGCCGILVEVIRQPLFYISFNILRKKKSCTECKA